MLALAKYGSGKGIGKHWMGGIIALELLVVAIKPLKTCINQRGFLVHRVWVRNIPE